MAMNAAAYWLLGKLIRRLASDQQSDRKCEDGEKRKAHERWLLTKAVGADNVKLPVRQGLAGKRDQPAFKRRFSAANSCSMA